MKKKCLNCNIEFETKHKTQKYCCYECSRQARCTLVEKICPTCGKVFKPISQRQKYCTHKCSTENLKFKGIRETYKCMYCNKEFELIPGHNTKYCSRECYYNAAKAGLIFRDYKKGISYEERYGSEKAELIKNKQRKHKWSDEDKLRISKQRLGKKRSKETCEKLRQLQLSKEHQEKIYNTKKKNKTFNTSKNEKSIEGLLITKFKKIECQYKSERYPFSCDFYISDLDLYIEYQGHWSHGLKPFEGTEEDLLKLEIWKNKNTSYYNNAIHTWTVRDVLKRQIAKENDLNWLEFFTEKEFMNWFKNL